MARQIDLVVVVAVVVIVVVAAAVVVVAPAVAGAVAVVVVVSEWLRLCRRPLVSLSDIRGLDGIRTWMLGCPVS